MVGPPLQSVGFRGKGSKYANACGGPLAVHAMRRMPPALPAASAARSAGPPVPEAHALANWWTQHAHDAFLRLSASAPVAVNPEMQESISNAILAYRAANTHLSNDDINAGVIELVKSFHQ